MGAKEPLRVGIVGCGNAARWHHIPSLLKTKGAQLMALCDTNEDLARGVTEKVIAQI